MPIKKKFHLAIPVRDLAEAKTFYESLPHVTIGRTKETSMVMNFFNDQVVCHLSPDHVPAEVTMYPRHFGVVLEHHQDFKRIYNTIKDRNPEIIWEDRFHRYAKEPAEHETFFIKDPSNNLIEFKYFHHHDHIY
jgi:extradiol dioxygenase family protein